MRQRALVVVAWLAAGAGCDACGDPPAPPLADDATPPRVRTRSCETGARHCRGNQVWECRADESFAFVHACAADATCVVGDCQANPSCAAGERHCHERALLTCRSDGSGYDTRACDPGWCVDGACSGTDTACAPGTRVCVDGATATCADDGSGWLEPPHDCGAAVCLDGTCQERICSPGVAHCQQDVALVCNTFGTGYLARVCSPAAPCLDGRCQAVLCPSAHWCDGNTALTCNDERTQIIARQDCAAAPCVEGTCQGAPDDGGAGRDLLSGDVLLRDVTTRPDAADADVAAMDGARPDDGPALEGGEPGDAGVEVDGATNLDCRVVPCAGFTYCDTASGRCEAGCARDSQCPGSWCDLARHVCVGTDAGGPGDAAGLPGADGAGTYEPDGGGAVVPELCPATEQVAPGGLAPLDEGRSWLCDGLDNDCDGHVDEGCPCRLGDVQRCFLGPPGRHDVGACEDGLQTCVSRASSVPTPPVWGPCSGGIAPRAEACDQLDNDCNGCVDEIEGCTGVGSCPGPGDPRVPEGRPFSTYPLRGADFYPGEDAVSWRWSVSGTPCDRSFQALRGSTATSTNGQLSYTLHDAAARDAGLQFTLSGDYTVQLDVGLQSGRTFTCTWIVHVRAPGLRIELCWDATGPTAERYYGGPLDIDLHLGKLDVTGRWFDPHDCDYSTCTGMTSLHSSWGYATTPIDNCSGPGARGSFAGRCPNPRLDIDNIWETEEYVPENINLDNPRQGDRFRVMVHHYDIEDRPARPLVNVYCGGELRGTYGALPDQVAGFDRGGGRELGSMWRVVDVTTEVDAQGTTTGCRLGPLVDRDGEGYFVTFNDSSL